MANRTPNPSNFFDKLREMEYRLNLRIDNRAGFDASQLNRTVAKLEELVAGLLTQVNGIFSGYITAGGNVTAGGTGTFAAGINSVGAYGLDVSLLAGARRTGWWHVSGAAGYAPSTLRTKTDVDGYGATAMQFLNCMPVIFHYVGQLDIRDNPLNPQYDPGYEVPLEVGHLAELLVANGLSDFVFWDEDGEPAGINMAEFAAVGFVIVGRDHEARLRRLEAKA